MAVAISTPKHQTIVKCPICLDTLAEPRMFGCFHFYCQKCVHDMKEVKQDETVGYECPLCRKFTAEGQLQSLPIIAQILEAINSSAHDKPNCDNCKAESSSFRCMDCKENFCKSCRDVHDGFSFLRHHQWEAIEDSAKPIIDKLVHCKVHDSKPVELHCRDCKQLICILCKGTSHNHHNSAETIEEALRKILPIVKENQGKVKAVIEATNTDITKEKKKLDNAKRTCEDARKATKEKFEELLEKLKEDYRQLENEVNIMENDIVARHEARVKQLELQLQSQENVLSLSQSTLDTAQNVSLLEALQFGVLDSLKGSLDGANIVPEVIEARIEFLSIRRPETNVLGSVRKVWKNTGLLDMSCDDLLTKEFHKTKQINISVSCFHFDVINDELWCVDSHAPNNIHIYSTDGTKTGTVQSDSLKTTYSVVAYKFHNKALVSASKGLFTVSTDERHDVIKLFDGNFCDVSVQDDIVYALTADGSAKVYVLKQSKNNDSLEPAHQFTLLNFHNNVFNSIQATSDHVFVAIRDRHAIQHYTLDGQLVREHDKQGSSYVGQFQYPFVIGRDSFSNILIAGGHNHCLDVRKTDGSFDRLFVPCDIPYPMCARTYSGKLYISLYNAKNIIVFDIVSIHNHHHGHP